MPLPAGIATATVTLGKAGGVLGTAAVVEAKVAIDQVVIWAATGEAIYPFAEPVPVVDGVASFPFPLVDQPGFADEHGRAVTGFQGVVTATLRFSPKDVRTLVREFQVVTGDTEIELSLIPVGGLRPENAVAASSYAEQAKGYLDQAATSAGAASDSAGDADTARLGALAAQAAAEAAQQAALEQVTAATEQANAAAGQATAAAGSATAASEQRALAETARTGAEAAHAAIPTLPTLAQNRVKDPYAWGPGGTGGQTSTTTTPAIGGPEAGDGGPYTRRTYIAPTTILTPGVDIFFGSAEVGKLAAVSPGEWLLIGCWVRSSVAQAVRPQYVALSSLTPPTGGSGSESGASTVLVPNQWTLLTHAVSMPVAAEIGWARVDVDTGIGAIQWATGDTIDVTGGFVLAAASSFRNGISPALAPFTSRTPGARLNPVTGLHELVLPRSSDLVAIARSANRYIEGVGSPLGVVSAPVGWRYIDTAATNGAVEWISTAAGASGWAVVYGDTGWRDITASVTNGWAATLLQIRRVNEQVSLRVEGLNPAARTTTGAFPIPAGFQPRGYGRELLFTAASPPVIRRVDWGVPGFLVANSTTSDGLFYGTFTAPVENPAWPATLPGNPA